MQTEPTPQAPAEGAGSHRNAPVPSPSVLPAQDPLPRRPPNVTHLSTPSYESPLRHHRRQPSAHKIVKEDLKAHTIRDDSSVHRINQYVIKQEIGRGSFGAVHLAVDHLGTEYAVKEFSKSRLRKRAQSNILRRPHGPQRRGRLGSDMAFTQPLHRRSASEIHEDEGGSNPLHLIQQEIAIMKKINHSNLVNLYEVLDDPAEDSLYMVLEMCKKGVVMKVGMHEVADPYAPESCRCWFRDLVLGIEYLHAQGVCHRDIKPDNLLLTHDDVLKVVDFGVSEIFEKDSDMTTAKSAGSPAFLPPELCVSHHGTISGKAADVWSMGVTLYCLYYGRVPFEKTAPLELYEAIKKETPELSPNDHESHGDLVDLMARLLEKDPQRRITIPQIREHPWVTKRGTDPLLSSEENCTDIIEPNEDEIKRAITSNLSKLLVTMKAVRKFKSLLSRRQSHVLSDSSDHAGMTQSPTAMSPPLERPQPAINPPTAHRHHKEAAASRPSSATTALHYKAFSEDVYDRLPIEQTLVQGGVHRHIDADIEKQLPSQRDGSAVLHRPMVSSPVELGSAAKFESENSAGNDPDRPDSAAAPSGERHIDARPERHRSHPQGSSGSRSLSPLLSPGKGHAHDPLEEFLYVGVGPGDEGRRQDTTDGVPLPMDSDAETSAQQQPAPSEAPPIPIDSSASPAAPAVNEPVVVSESPPAADDDIFEQAYFAEVRRIRSQTLDANVYLNRRIDDTPSSDHTRKDECGVPRVLKDLKRGATDPRSSGGGGISSLAQALKELATKKREEDAGQCKE